MTERNFENNNEDIKNAIGLLVFFFEFEITNGERPIYNKEIPIDKRQRRNKLCNILIEEKFIYRNDLCPRCGIKTNVFKGNGRGWCVNCKMHFLPDSHILTDAGRNHAQKIIKDRINNNLKQTVNYEDDGANNNELDVIYTNYPRFEMRVKSFAKTLESISEYLLDNKPSIQIFRESKNFLKRMLRDYSDI